MLEEPAVIGVLRTSDFESGKDVLRPYVEPIVEVCDQLNDLRPDARLLETEEESVEQAISDYELESGCALLRKDGDEGFEHCSALSHVAGGIHPGLRYDHIVTDAFYENSMDVVVILFDDFIQLAA